MSTDTEKLSDGAFKRKASEFRNWITADGSSGFKAESNRYHLYVADACPWAHRTRVVRSLKGLEDVISLSRVDTINLHSNWAFTDDPKRGDPDPIHGRANMGEVYHAADPNYGGRFTVPVLFDKKTDKIVSNESSEIIRMLNSEVCHAGGIDFHHIASVVLYFLFVCL